MAKDETGATALVDADKLKQTVAKIEAAKSDMDSARSAVGNIYSLAQKDDNIHTGALKHCLKLKKMSPNKRADYLRAVQTYIGILGLDAQGELDLPPAQAAE